MRIRQMCHTRPVALELRKLLRPKSAGMRAKSGGWSSPVFVAGRRRLPADASRPANSRTSDATKPHARTADAAGPDSGTCRHPVDEEGGFAAVRRHRAVKDLVRVQEIFSVHDGIADLH